LAGEEAEGDPRKATEKDEEAEAQGVAIHQWTSHRKVQDQPAYSGARTPEVTGV
jgi:hypothetical protein